MDTIKKFVKKATSTHSYTPKIDLDHTQLPESDGTFVKNFQEHPQSLVLTSSITPILEKLHPDGRYCIGQDSGIYWKVTKPPEKGAEAPDWFYVPNVPPLLKGKYRRSYVMWKELVPPLLAIEFVSGNGSEERDDSPPPEDPNEIDPKTGEKKKAGKFWVYEQAVKIPYYAIYEESIAAVEVYHLVNGRYQLIKPNKRGHFSIPIMGIELGIQYDQKDPPTPWLRFWDGDGNLLLTGDERAVVEMQARLQAEVERSLEQKARQEAEAAQKQAEAIADQANLIAEQERNEKIQERIAKEQAEAIADRANLEKQEAEAIAEHERNEKLQERLAKEQAEAIAEQANLEKQQAEAIADRANLEKQQAEIAQQLAEQKAQRLAEMLKALGINTDEIL
ncbi:Uma2 family endonuclease [Tumidithrix elongata RA019]|uniref:Uma2 family endonuclease n=1 Tax=Tumidithrix elongata BACA0141 TaxID=2716417 RepID=A0AAW9Q942_9CYAN|nr:Uma2 family endonuclease [Tumidithrix elongata RA019]